MMQDFIIISTNIDAFIKKNEDELIMHRRWFHQHPETSFKEYNTSEYIIDYLIGIGANNIKKVATTGIVCDIGTGNNIHAVRCNMDALPIYEETGLPYRSLYLGYSHACGHDFELAWGLLIAKYFQENKPCGVLRLIFQPAEEGPGEESHGKTGGQVLAELGVFDVDSVMSLHVEPELPLGVLSITDGEVTCGAYDFDFVLQGITCHAAKPEQGENPIPIAADLIGDIYAMEKDIKSEINDEEGFVLITVSSLSSRLQSDKNDIEETINTIPEYVIIKGITRLRSQSIEHKVVSGLKRIETKYQEVLQDCKLNIRKVAVATQNNKDVVDVVIRAAHNHDISVISRRTKWRDDAGWASERAASAHGFIGINDGVQTKLHSPAFNPNEKGLIFGLKIFLSALNKLFKTNHASI